ncbi:MAG: phosphoribosylformylglycinamidine cyclo-ligase [Bdellovibrionaceae bacterium]|nr:phosphoribosylformylglycinamidine cyclo-ligase [Pseudobdellovibrionaceae bacterium]
MDYKQSGVDVEKGDQFVDWIQETQSKGPHANKVISGVGGFASIMRFDFPEYKEPCLVSSTDGVGTKVKLAVQFASYEGVGQDLVAMCVNDLACCGAQPLFFLDYYATGKLQLEQAKPFLAGVRKACDFVGAQLVGGETAEMPGVYHNNDFDCAGFSVGVVDRKNILGPERVKAGDAVLGVASSGFHSNGFSLLRKVFANDLDQWKDELLKPTALYSPLVQDLLPLGVHAVAHITGGGMENIPRVIPSGLSLKLKDWQWPAPFIEVQKRTGMSHRKMLETLNCGIGLVVILPSEQKEKARELIQKNQFQCFDLGIMASGETPLIYPHEES